MANTDEGPPPVASLIHGVESEAGRARDVMRACEGTQAPHVLSSWLLAILAVLPYLLVYVFHLLRQGPGLVATGFVHIYMPYYVANGRAVFERGNGFFGPNPFDPAPGAPAIYVHWFTWMLGFCVHVLGASPGALFAWIGVVAAVLFSRATLALVDRCGGRGPNRGVVFLMSMWGGGLATLATFLAGVNGYARDRLSFPLHEFEAGSGWWFVYWGRNACFATESIYHILMIGAWLGAIRRRWHACFFCVFLLTTTHPFTGVQCLATFLTWLILGRFVPVAGRVPTWFALAVLANTVAFLGYYFVYLPRYPEHRALQAVWAIPWVERPVETLVAYLPVALLSLYRLRSDGWRPDRTVLFLLTSGAISFGLAHHDWFVPPHQPMHFSRGYVWMPLYIVGIPALRDVLLWLGRLPARRLLVVLTFSAVMCLDNIAWLSRIGAGVGERGVYLSPGTFDVYRELSRRETRGILLCREQDVSYLAAVYTPARPYFGHHWNTPLFEEREQQVEDWYSSGREYDWLSRIDLVLERTDRPKPIGLDENWVNTYQNNE